MILRRSGGGREPRLSRAILAGVAGTLFVIATPLGNLGDLSPRAADTLRQVACIACEDTRRTARLLARHGIETPTISCHKFNEKERLIPVLDRLRAGEDVGLVSDGGSPGIADPGALLVRTALESGIPVCPLPGPSAVTTLLSASGFPADRYVFDGFLPHRAGERRRRLRALRREPRTLVLFEAPHRIQETLGEIEQIFGDRPLVLGRELTKQYETILSGDATEVARRLGDPVKGEITLVLAGARDHEQHEELEPQARKIVEAWKRALIEEGGNRRGALRRAARALGLNRAELNRRLAELGEEP
jgi:16S rRNA (cytidine1402-2'-O)-methyltransferase